MGNWERQQTMRKERDKVRRENMSKFFYDMAKLVFVTIVLGEILLLPKGFGSTTRWFLIGIGIYCTYIFAWIGNKILK